MTTYYTLDCRCKFESYCGRGFDFVLELDTLPTTDAALEWQVDYQAKAIMADRGYFTDSTFDYAYVEYEPIEGEPNIGRSGNCYIFYDETQNEGCLPLPSIEAAREALDAYARYLCYDGEDHEAIEAERAAYNEPEHLAYLDDLCRHVGA